MSNPWLRLWNDMPTDPKWRTISRLSGASISEVIAVYIHVLVNASNATERGRTESLQAEDLASALDLDEGKISKILEVMQGRVLDGDRVSGWEKRQPAREDGSAARAKAWREARKEKEERNRTQPNAEERSDTDTDTDTDKNNKTTTGEIPKAENEKPKIEYQEIANLYNEILGTQLRAVRDLTDQRKKHIKARIADDREKRLSLDWWRKYFELVSESDLLMGQVPAKGESGQPWQADFDWLINQNNMTKTLEGKYHRE